MTKLNYQFYASQNTNFFKHNIDILHSLSSFGGIFSDLWLFLFANPWNSFPTDLDW